MTTNRVSVAASVTALTLLAVLVAGCTSPDTKASDIATAKISPTTTPLATAPPTTATTDPTRCVGGQGTMSFTPNAPAPAPRAMPPDSSMAEIFDNGNGVLRVGVDETTRYFSEKDQFDGTMKGFEADLARAIARAIFGDVDDLDRRIKFVTVTTEEKFEVVQKGEVDMMISVASMSCGRWNLGYDFSSPYYEAFQQLAVPAGSPITSQADLSGKRVCVTAPSGSKGSSETLLEGLNEKANAKIVIVRVATRPKCAIKVQEGKADAIVLPSSIMAGLLDQDPTLHAIDTQLNDFEGQPSTNTYGIVTNPQDRDLLLFVNALLAQWRDDGTLQGLMDENLPLELPHAIPSLRYRG